VAEVPPALAEQWSAVDAYLVDAMIPPDAALDDALAESTRAGLPAINVSPTQGKFLQLLAQIRGARRILEIGTLAGYSTIWLARALPKDGIITLEYEPRHAEVARRNFARAGCDRMIDVRVGPALDELPKIAAAGEGPFDLVFIDANKDSIPQYITWTLKLTKPGSVIVVDNVIRKGAVVDAASTDKDVRRVRQFNEMLKSEKRLNGTALQTVGGKGYDGFALLVVV
jgi:predicted O-methyltransferase YrrM